LVAIGACLRAQKPRILLTAGRCYLRLIPVIEHYEIGVLFAPLTEISQPAQPLRLFQHEVKVRALIIRDQDADGRRSANVQIGISAAYSFNENFSFLAGSPRC
jgi:hypothetical protein